MLKHMLCKDRLVFNRCQEYSLCITSRFQLDTGSSSKPRPKDSYPLLVLNMFKWYNNHSSKYRLPSHPTLRPNSHPKGNKFSTIRTPNSKDIILWYSTPMG